MARPPCEELQGLAGIDGAHLVAWGDQNHVAVWSGRAWSAPVQLPALEIGCRDPDPAVRSAAIAALGKVCCGASVPRLVWLLRHETDREIRAACLRSIANVDRVQTSRVLWDLADWCDAAENRLIIELVGRSPAWWSA